MEIESDARRLWVPGRKAYWQLDMDVDVSHHNSITLDYVQKDTLYPILKPRLLKAIQAGEISPYEYAIIEDWYVAVKSERQEAAFGFLNTLFPQDLIKTNQLRQALGVRSVETRNSLVEIQNQTGMDFYLTGKPWVKGKIMVDENR